MPKLEIGSGTRPLDGYEHLDINPDSPCVEYVAPMNDIPVEDNYFEEIQSIHVIEHQPWKDTLSTLKEWVRVLKPGGMLRLATPNLRWIAECYLQGRRGNTKHFMEDANKMTEGELKRLKLNEEIDVALWANFKIMSSGIKWDEHYACYDARLLTDLLKKAGCSKVEIEHDGDSLILRAYK